MLSWVALQFERDGIEADLGSRTQNALARSGLTAIAPSFDGRDAILRGQASEDTDAEKAARATRNVWGVRIADSQLDLLDAVRNFIWSAAKRSDGGIVLTGVAPNASVRGDVIAAAKAAFPGSDVSDKMTLARGGPNRDAWTAGAKFALSQLAKLKTGEATLEALALTVTGEAPSVDAYKSVKTALAGKLPGGVSLARESITPPRVEPYTWAIASNGGQVEITGYNPSDSVKSSIASRAKAAFPRGQLKDRTELANGAPNEWTNAVSAIVDQLAKLNSGSATFNGREVMFTGDAADEQVAAAVRKSLRTSVPQSFKLTEQIRFPRLSVATEPGGYVMAIANDGTAIVVSGYVPSEASRSALVDAVKARFAGRSVTDQLQVRPGAPEGWQQCIVAGLAALPRLVKGKAELRDRSLRVTGSANDYGVATSVPLDVKAAAGQICEANADIAFEGQLRTDLSWKAIRENARRVVLKGDVPDDRARVRLAEAAQQYFPSTNVADEMQVVGAPSEGWLPAALKALEQLARLEQGEAALNAKQVSVRGLAKTEQLAADVRAAVKGDLPQGFEGAPDITVMSAVEQQADQCQDLMQEATSRGILQFERAKADLTTDSTDTLKELVQVANECRRFRIEIEGHTDAEGTDERNQRLSDRRARAVADFLTREGIDATRLSTVGYGATRPIADNETADGRARNRRIEFIVKAN